MLIELFSSIYQWSTLFHQFLYPTSTPPQPLAAYSPLPIAAVLELRMLSAAVAASLGPPGAEHQTADSASNKAKEAWKGGVRQLSLLAGRPKAPSAESGLHDAVQSVPSFTSESPFYPSQ